MNSLVFDRIIIKSFNGIGDLLFVTPTLKKIKEFYPNIHITVNTNYPDLLLNNPFIDKIGSDNEGIFLGYPDPIHAKNPIMHHIQFDYQIVKRACGLNKLPLFLTEDEAVPEIYLKKYEGAKSKIGVQVVHKGHWNKKKVWPFFSKICFDRRDILEPIVLQSIPELIKTISSYKAVLCAEGGISHIAKAVGTHAIVVYGGFAKPAWNGYKDHDNICKTLPCSYCYNPFPCKSEYEERECMRNISIDHIVNRIKKVK